MPHVKPKQIFLILSFLAIIFVDGLWLASQQILNGQRLSVLDLLRRPPTPTNLRAYETDLKGGSTLGALLRVFTQGLHFRLLHDAGKKSIQGVDGWWFYDLDIRYLTERSVAQKDQESNPESMFQSVLSFQRELGERGIQLLLVPAPGKPSIYPDKLTRRAAYLSTPVNPHTREILSRLEAAGVEVVNLFDLYQSHRSRAESASHEALYLTQDTHWSPLGMRMAAKAVADRLLQLQWTEKGSTEYGLNEARYSPRVGDVLAMSQSPLIQSWVTPESIAATQVVKRSDGQLYQDDRASEVLVLGDSFLRIYERDEPGSGGFVAHLAHELQKPLTSIINDGGASTLVRQELYRKPELLAGKKVVIWEFVERDIRFGTEGWQDVPLPQEKQEQ